MLIFIAVAGFAIGYLFWAVGIFKYFQNINDRRKDRIEYQKRMEKEKSRKE